ncbi:MAG: efflux RND transporter periplasmic adaptor subunit [Negativicutes bacterium]|nr:efflux RND transporter periplasmic adaptor subunit [Negativicutes bacterium]
MTDKLFAKDWLIGGLAAVLLVAGGGYYYYSAKLRNGVDRMPDKLFAKKWLIGGVIAVFLVAGGGGYYYYSAKKKAASEHAGHQMGAMPIMVTGDVVQLDAQARQLAGVQTATVTKRQLTKEIKTTGKIALNESSRAYITSRVEGRVDELYVSAEGDTITPGQVIASVYSPTYIAAQEEYLLALDSVQKLRGASRDVVQLNNRLLEAAKRKLRLLNIPEGDIEQLASTRQTNDHMPVRAQFGGTVMEKTLLPGGYIMPGDKLFTLSDLSSVWLYADVYEKDIAGIRGGLPVQVTASAYPGEAFSGVVTFIAPVVDDATRTVKVRIEMANPDGKLKPNLFVNAAIGAPLGESLVIPVSSLLDTGTRKIVFVAQSEDTFVKRDIVTGQEGDGYIQVLSGLQPGETVVTAATFLIDSQTQLGSMGGMAGMDMGSPGGKNNMPGMDMSGSTSQPAPPAAKAPAANKQTAPMGGMDMSNMDHSGHSGH